MERPSDSEIDGRFNALIESHNLVRDGLCLTIGRLYDRIAKIEARNRELEEQLKPQEPAK